MYWAFKTSNRLIQGIAGTIDRAEDMPKLISNTNIHWSVKQILARFDEGHISISQSIWGGEGSICLKVLI